MSFPLNLFLLVPLLADDDRAKAWVVKMDLVKSKRWCADHNRWLKFVDSGHFGTFECQGTIDGMKFCHKVSAAENTWFERIDYGVRQRIILTYLFANQHSHESAMREASIGDSIVTSEMVFEVFSQCREVCKAALALDYVEKGPIGGEGIVVEIDLCKIGQQKDERGSAVEGQWILGMIERGGSGYRLEVCPNNCRSQEVLLPLIKKHVKLKTEIHTDLWEGYSNLEHHGYTQVIVENSKKFSDSRTGASIQNIKYSWNNLRKRLKRVEFKSDFDLHLSEFLWRRMNKKKDPFRELIRCIKLVYPGSIDLPTIN